MRASPRRLRQVVVTAAIRCAATGSLLGGLLAACTTPAPPPAAALLRDEFFAVPAVGIDAARIFEMSAAMRRYADAQLLDVARAGPDRRRALVDAFVQPGGGLRLGYDSSFTRTAAETYAQRAGNCLSLVILAASFARYLGLPVQFQSVLVDEAYARSGDLFVAAGHVNLVLGSRSERRQTQDANGLTIDFVPPAPNERRRNVPIDEHRIAAMFMNNRAAEALEAGRLDDSYAWARAALRADARFAAGINTLAVVYQRAGHPAAAERAFEAALDLERDNASALANLAALLRAQGRAREAAPLEARLAALQPVPPLWYLERGREALGRGEFAQARDLLQRELQRQPFQHEAHFLLARAHAALGERAAAERHLALAAAYGPTLGLQALYAGKLQRLRAQGAH
ncbi:MAG: hypothetical protein AMXMBFR66_05760 [Pseudomonadota bacterium]|nr:tetratricopeptide repeat protein [Rubrivivax sp.]NLZ41594.1 tetratricopeptide repeat protein [Comamonadaceae bacterium]